MMSDHVKLDGQNHHAATTHWLPTYKGNSEQDRMRFELQKFSGCHICGFYMGVDVINDPTGEWQENNMEVLLAETQQKWLSHMMVNHSTDSQLWSSFAMAMKGGLPVNCNCPSDLKDMNGHEMEHLKFSIPLIEKKEDKKDNKDDKKDQGRKRQRKPSENASKKYRCEESGCTYGGNGKYHLDQHIRARHMKIKLKCDQCDFKCGDPR